MNVFTNIREIKIQVERLKKQVPYIKNQQQMDDHIGLVNSMVLLVNDVELLVENQIKTDVIDKLILALMHEGFKHGGVDNLHQIIREIGDIIKYPKSLQMEYLTGLFMDVQTNSLLDKIPFKTKDKNWKKFKITFPKHKIDTNKITDDQLNDIIKEFKQEPTEKEYEDLLNKQLILFKQQIQ